MSKSKGIGGASVARVRPDEPRLAKIESSLLDVVGPWTNTKYIKHYQNIKKVGPGNQSGTKRFHGVISWPDAWIGRQVGVFLLLVHVWLCTCYSTPSVDFSPSQLLEWIRGFPSGWIFKRGTCSTKVSLQASEAFRVPDERPWSILESCQPQSQQ